MKKEKKSSSLLDNIIKLLIILLLLGALTLVALFTLEKLKTDEIQAIKPSTKIIKKTTTSKEKFVKPTQNETNKKVYSQEDMQEIVQMMMEQMQELNKETKNSETTLSINKENKEEENINELIQSLQDIKEDDIQNEIPQIDKKSENIEAKNTNTSDNHYNKVVIDDSIYSDENLDTLSQKIGNIINDISTNKVNNSTYTKDISKEIDTRVDEMRVIIVKKGDTLTKIALRAYGKVSAYHKLLDANKDLIKNPNNIYVGQRLRVPTL